MGTIPISIYRNLPDGSKIKVDLIPFNK
jgi:hypothetical protein